MCAKHFVLTLTQPFLLLYYLLLRLVCSLSLHVSLTADDAVANKKPSVEERKPTAEAQTEAKGGDDGVADEELCSTSSILGNVSETVNQEFLEMLVENVLKNSDSPSGSQNFTLESFPDISSTVVTFQSAEGSHYY